MTRHENCKNRKNEVGESKMRRYFINQVTYINQCFQLGSICAQTGFRLGKNWVQTGFRLGSEWVQSGFRMGSEWVQSVMV